MAIERMSWFLIARLIELDRRIEAFDVADHEGDAGVVGGGDDGAALLHCRSDRLFDHDMHASGNTREREIVVQMGRRGNGHGIDTAGQQRFEIVEFSTAYIAGDKLPLLVFGIDNPDQFNAGHLRQDARMVAAHDADADHTDFQRNTPTHPASFRHNPKGSPQR